MIDNLTKTSLVGTKIADTSIQANEDTLLRLVNMAKNKIAEDTLLWLDGEEITMVTDTYEYTLTNMPIQIIDVYDDNQYLRPRNSNEYLGYYQTAPNKVKFNSVTNGQVVYVNYYSTPADYLITDEVVVPHTLLSAMEFYVAHKAFEIYKSEADMFSSAEYYKKYTKAMQDFVSATDSVDVDAISSNIDRIWRRGIR